MATNMAIHFGARKIVISQKDHDKVRDFSGNSLEVVETRTSGVMYAVIRKREDGKQKPYMLARIILNLLDKPHRIVIYKDGDPLNLLRENLMVTTRSKSSRKGKTKNTKRECTSSFMGVSFNQQANKFRAMIKPSKGKPNKFLGYYPDELDAAQAYNDAAIKYHGEFATLNKIPKKKKQLK